MQKLFQLSGAASGGSQPLTSGFVSSVLSIQVGFCFLFKHTTQDLNIWRQLGRFAPWNKQDLKKERELLSLGCFLCTALVKEKHHLPPHSQTMQPERLEEEYIRAAAHVQLEGGWNLEERRQKSRQRAARCKKIQACSSYSCRTRLNSVPAAISAAQSRGFAEIFTSALHTKGGFGFLTASPCPFASSRASFPDIQREERRSLQAQAGLAEEQSSSQPHVGTAQLFQPLGRPGWDFPGEKHKENGKKKK